MTIKDTFAKNIARDIKGVIKVGQDDDSDIRQELEEYVVTRELQKHFRDFFSSYKRGINGHTDKMGVWISGFFGSGKSHFLKILSYLLSGTKIDGKKAIDYFIEDNKISDPMVLADMKLASSVPTDVILFNIDSKGEMNGKQSKDAIVSVFLKVFNEMQGFYGAQPQVADLERSLTERGKYAEFKRHFAESFGDSWEEGRSDIGFAQDSIADALVASGVMSEESARNWCDHALDEYNFSIERFAELVKKYIESRGGNHHVVFLVDEIGQYIGEDSKLMLNLQTVTEDLGTACRGKAWIVVTSQQDIDSITKVKGNDFSKIQGRFDTRLSLSAANVDEVIRERVLKKNATGRDTLALLYDAKETEIKNKIIFDDAIEKKLYAGRESFASDYPFIPYQFMLLGNVLTQIRTHGASGKHLAEGARSMLALFQESAIKVMDKEPGALVPFSMFYDALDKFLDHSHRGVILSALDNAYLNPTHAETCFDVEVLKTLFLIKYVKEIKADLNNITSLMVSHIDEDRLGLSQRVEDALNRLIRQTLVQKNGDIYIFLTNEEQEINQAIKNEHIEPAEITQKVGEMIFDGIYSERKYRHSAFNGRYAFAFNQMIDERPYKANQNNDITLRVLTPNTDVGFDDATLRLISSQSNVVLVSMPDDRAFLEEIETSLQIQKFLLHDAAVTATKYEELKATKRREMSERDGAARLFLTEALKAAAVYIGGDAVRLGTKDVPGRLNEAMGKLVEKVYHKLDYITAPMGEADIRRLLDLRQSQQLTLEGTAAPNELALGDVKQFIEANRHGKTSMKTLLDRFMKAPYGFVEADVQWLAAKLFKDGEISLFVNNEAITLFSKTPDEIVKYLTRREYTEKLLMEKRVKVSLRAKKSVREAAKELFGLTFTSDDDDAMMRDFLRCADSLNHELERLAVNYQNQPLYPGRGVIETGRVLLTKLLQMKYPAEFFAEVDGSVDELLDFAEDVRPVKKFFSGDQRGIFDKTLATMRIYDESKNFIVSAEIEAITAQIDAILKKPAPYGEIYKLPGLRDQFNMVYSGFLDEVQQPVMNDIAAAKKRVEEALCGKLCEQKLYADFMGRFAALEEKAGRCSNVATLNNIRQENDAVKIRCLNEITAAEAKLLEQQAQTSQSPAATAPLSG